MRQGQGPSLCLGNARKRVIARRCICTSGIKCTTKGSTSLQARPDDRQISIDRLSSVPSIKFQLSPGHVAAFPRKAKIVIEHAKFQAEQKLTPNPSQELAVDFE